MAERVDSRHASRPHAIFWPIGLTIVALGTLARLWQLRNRPGWEWDEGVYTYIARNLFLNGEMAFKTEYVSQSEPYLYHPPFYFKLLAQWFGLVDPGINQARVFAVAGAAVTMVLLLALLRRTIGDTWALIGVTLIAADTWLNFSQRVSWIENTLMPIGIFGLLLYTIALERNKWWWYIAAGSVVGFATIYKHIGILFLGVIIVHAFLIRENWRKNLAAIGAAFVTIAGYVGAAVIVYGPVYVHASTIQFARSTGEQKSAGALDTLGDIVGPLLSQYRIYVATMVLAGIAVMLVCYRFFQILRHRCDADSVRPISVLYAWAFAAVLFFVGLQLRFPHYSMLAFIPLFCYLIAELSRVTLTRWRIVLLGLAGIVVFVANVFAFQARFITPSNDAALRDVQQFAIDNIPHDSKVIADESTAAVIPQPFCTMWRGKDCTDATYIIVYRSSTQQPENNNGQQELIDSGTLVFETKGFKEEIAIYKLSEPVQ